MMQNIYICSPTWQTQYLIGGFVIEAGLQRVAYLQQLWNDLALCMLQFADTIFYNWTLAFLIKSPWQQLFHLSPLVGF